MTLLYWKDRFPRLLLGLIGALVSAGSSGAQVETIYHMMRRITPGFSLVDLQNARAMGFQAYLDSQLLNHTLLMDADGTVLVEWPIVDFTPQQVQQVYGSTLSLGARQDLQRAHLWRAIKSQQAFFERASWFWANHFSIDFNKRAGAALVPYFEKHVTREHAFGQFRDMVHASSGTDRQPVPVQGAMALLHYLDNNANRCFPMPNENYAREVLELHILGTTDYITGASTQVYTETDIRQLARGLTGWTFQLPFVNPNYLNFKFETSDHCVGDIDFMGVTIPEDNLTASQGIAAIDVAFDYMDPPPPAGLGVGHVSAEFIARKLVRAFLTDRPLTEANATQTVAIRRAVSDAVNAYGLDGNITGMLQAILTEQNISDVLDATEPMFKFMTPRHFMINALRATHASITTTNGIEEARRFLEEDLGQAPFNFGPPIGYPEAIQVWAQNQPARWKFAYRLVERKPSGRYGTLPGIAVNVPRLYLPLGGFDRATCAIQASQIITGGNLSAAEVQIIQNFADQSPDLDREMAWKVLMLVFLAPGTNLF